MSSQNTTTVGEEFNTPLKMFQPMNLIVYMTTFSPIIIALSITSLSFIFQNFKGLIYLGFLIGCCFVRSYVYMMSGSETMDKSSKSICNSVQYVEYGNPTVSAFVFAFTIMYLSIPMFSNNYVNYWVFISLLAYFFMDIFIKIYKNCIIKMGDLILNILLGAASATLIVSLMYSGGSGKYLFFNEMSSDKEMCYQPSTQTFKCSVYKNGEMISSL